MNAQVMFLIKLLGEQKSKAEQYESKYENAKKEIEYMVQLIQK